MPKKVKKMFEQIKHNMETITGVAIYPILSLLIFFLFFVGLGIWVSSYKKEKIKELSNIPLDDSIKK
jgi:cytochrome c oxidase cbb3-type subunit IV